MPWCGPTKERPFPTLGDAVAQWIQEFVVIPDGPLRGEPFVLYDEQYRHLLHAYRLEPNAPGRDRMPRVAKGSEWFVHYGTQLVRPQKWGKDPFGAARICAEVFGPVRFDGWDADGQPVGREVDTPWVQIVATADEQTANTYRPLQRMLREGPLGDIPGLDVGEDRTKLPNGDGWIEPVTSSGSARLGQPITFASITEPHLLNPRNGGRKLARAIKRNLSGMGGLWQELTNPWDPSEDSEAQATFEAKAPGVYSDFRQARVHVDLDDEPAVRREVIYCYGDAAATNGGHVDERRILRDLADAAHDESDRRRYYLQEIVVGARDAVDPTKWTAAQAEDDLRAGEVVTLGFDGSRSRDCTSVVAVRVRDGRLFHLATWDPAEFEDHRIPRDEVDELISDAFDAYDVRFLYADPFKWQDYLDRWAGRWPKRVVEFPTNEERRMDRAIERFLTAFRSGELTHSGDDTLTAHAKSAALAAGKVRAVHDGEEPGLSRHYMRVVKKSTDPIDAFIAAIVGYAGRGQAIEDGALDEEDVDVLQTIY